jgi:hypothetical protein
MSFDEAASTEAWKVLVAESVQNLYGDDRIQPVSRSGTDVLRFDFPGALGSGYPAAYPHRGSSMEYIPKIELQEKRGPSGGGCG